MNLIQVIKIGGSLLQREGLLADLQSWQSSKADPMVNVWIVGGGAAVDAIRNQDARQGLSDATSHWASIKIMDANAAALAGRFPSWRVTDTPADILQSADRLSDHTSAMQHSTEATLPASQNSVQNLGQNLGQNWILQTHRWIKAADSQPNPQHQLPHSWHVTSDSIAAWVAIKIRATQVTLLKSCHIPTATVPELARLGIVDSYLPTLTHQRHDLRFACEYLPHASGSHYEKNTSNL